MSELAKIINYDLVRPLKEVDRIFTWIDGREIKPEHLIKVKRILFFDPIHLYEKVAEKLNPNKRHQSIQMNDIFPKVEGRCACGCDVKPKQYSQGKTLKWAAEGCQSFAGDVLSIMNNYFCKPTLYSSIYHGHKCCECPNTEQLELDHIVGVKQGGGACWLSNYRLLCKDCHTKKTNKDFAKGEFKNPEQYKLI